MVGDESDATLGLAETNEIAWPCIWASAHSGGATLPTEINTYGELKGLLNERNRVVSEGYGDADGVDGSLGEAGQDEPSDMDGRPGGSAGQPAVEGGRGGSNAAGGMGVRPVGSPKPGLSESDRPMPPGGERDPTKPVQSGGNRPRPVRGNSQAGGDRPGSDGGNGLLDVGGAGGSGNEPARSSLTSDRRGQEAESAPSQMSFMVIVLGKRVSFQPSAAKLKAR